ncbi:MAG: L-threonylcarbamoyladenylate synthase [Planctomycetota bacterium]
MLRKGRLKKCSAITNLHSQIERAVQILRQGGVVAFPTETVYGLGADAENKKAVRRIFKLKGRPVNHPLIVHLYSADMLADWAREVPPLARKLAAKFWPGPLTIILRRSQRVPDVVTGGLDTVALRVPDHPVALALLKAFGGGLAAPSANRFGCVSPTNAAHVRDEFGDALELILDGGPCHVGIESTIVDLSSKELAILRPGGVTREEIERVARQMIPVRRKSSVRAPGQFRIHYAPQAEIIVVSNTELTRYAKTLTARGRRVAVLSGALTERLPTGVVRLPAPRSSPKFARQLYALLRTADRLKMDTVLVCLPIETGLGLAIADRLRHAAGRG